MGVKVPPETPSRGTEINRLFCDECGSLQYPERPGLWTCRACDATTATTPDSDGAFVVTEDQREREISVVGSEMEFDPRPTTEEHCPECGHNEAYWQLEQLRAADESGTRFFTCTSCDHKWRADD
ncbi:transcription factor S [Haloarcula sediminis]|uniref:transcription factor S n=1 Tax=Haloarcula sediminis TaxID=3111777 RepID=UPI002D77733F|nr:transcription factor S [Haloarcula sp. CK38]